MKKDQLLKLKYVAAHMVKPVGLVSQHLAYVQSAPHANHTAQDAHLSRYPRKPWKRRRRTWRE